MTKINKNEQGIAMTAVLTAVAAVVIIGGGLLMVKARSNSKNSESNKNATSDNTSNQKDVLETSSSDKGTKSTAGSTKAVEYADSVIDSVLAGSAEESNIDQSSGESAAAQATNASSQANNLGGAINAQL